MKALYIPFLLLSTLLFSPNNGQAQCTDLFFSEYMEGSGFNKMLEIYNPTASGIDLSDYQITLYTNGDTVPGNILNWPAGTILGSEQVYVIGNGSADSLIQILADTLSSVTFYNGNDALVLTDTVSGTDLDIIGVVGTNPGSGGWSVGTGITTTNNTIVRKTSVNDGETDWSISVLGWDGYASNFADSLGSHSVDDCSATANPIASFQTTSGSSVEGDEIEDTAYVSLSDIDQNYDITVSISGGSASSGGDFSLVNGTGPYTITTGQSILAIPFFITDDTDDEGNETFTILISSAGGDVTIGNSEFSYLIIDDDVEPTPACTHPFFSEYIEGSSSNKMIEIYNPRDATIDLGGYRINRYNNGNDGSEDTSDVFQWPAGTMLASGDVYVIGNPSADSIFLTLDDTTSELTFYNGNDALELEEIATLTIVDVIGERGTDPGTSSGWPVGAGSTSNNTLVRSPSVNGGQSSWFLGSMTWEVYESNFSDSLGAHYMTPCSEPGPCDDVTISATGNVTNETVDGADDGAIDLTVNGGTEPYIYDWDNGDTTQDISGLADDSYTVTVTDSAGCTGTATFTVMPGTGICTGVTIDIAGMVTHESSLGANDGEVDITVTGGTTPYTYDWSNDDTTEDIEDLAPDTYTVTVTDSAGCAGMNSFTVNAGSDGCAAANIQISVVKTDESAAGAGDGSIDITVTGGTPPYTYLWSNGDTTQDVSGLVPASYSVTVTDQNNCTATVLTGIAAGPTAVNNIASLQIFDVYPNPASGKFQVELQFNSPEVIRLEVTDIAGRIVYNNYAGVVRSNVYTIENTWPAGLYFLKVSAGENIAVEPVMIY